MSGFLPDIASWALRGGSGNNGQDDNANGSNNNNGAGDNGAPAPPQLSEDEIRARRLARMGALSSAPPATTAESMEVDEESTAAAAAAVATSMEVSSPERKKAPSSLTVTTKSTSPPPATINEKSTKKARESRSPSNNNNDSNNNNSSSANDPTRKLQRKKELLLKKVLQVTLTSSSTATQTTNSADQACLSIPIDNPSQLDVQSIAEILATRLSLSDSQILTMPPQKPLIPYLAHAHRKAADELKTISSTSNAVAKNAKKASENEELVALLQEIQRQVVSYAASSLMIPDLFEQAKDGMEQLTKAFLSVASDPTNSITFGISGATSSFYYLLCEELHSQDPDAFHNVIRQVVSGLMAIMKKLESIDSAVSGDAGGPLGVVSALVALCGHKKAALVVTQLDSFLLPPAGSALAAQTIQPPVHAGADLLRMLTGMDNAPYLRRSGPALEKETLLGLVLRLTAPKSNPAFPPSGILRQSSDAVERTTNQQRQQLRFYQEACHQLIIALIKGGPDARANVMTWFTDCMLVNPGATAMRPDTSKVSSAGLLLNVSVALLKLCAPFAQDDAKHRLIDPNFVTMSDEGKLVFPMSGDNAISRLGERSDGDAMETTDQEQTSVYAPKNTFVPQVFYYTARSFALGIVPMLSSHENLLRHISHQHWELNSNNRDVASDPHFSMLISRQRSSEVALFEEEMIADTLRLANLMAKVIVRLSDDMLGKTPEHFVDNICDILMGIAKMKPKLLRGTDVRYIFQLVVKLLSPKYTTMVRNYNLRAVLGDVLHEIFLPATADDRRDVPTSVTCDPLAGGQTYLLSDPDAQKTLAPSLLLLYGEVEHTGYYDKMSHRAKIISLLKYLWESSEHRPAFRIITQNKESFIKFANGIINETNTLIATVMQKLPEIRATEEQMANATEWGRLSEEEQGIITSRLEDSEREVKHALPLCNKTLQMFGYLNTDPDIRSLFLLGELCPRLVNMLLHVLGKLVVSKGLKVKRPELYEFRPKEMLRDLCAIFGLFASSSEFQVECAKSGCDPNMLRSALEICQKFNLLTGESMAAFASLPDLVEKASRTVAEDEALLSDAPDEFLDEIMSTFMMDPVILPSGHFVDRSTITQHLLNDPIDPFNREEMTIDDIKPATELKAKIDLWLEEKRAARRATS